MKFSELSLIAPLQQAVLAMGYETASPIQEKSIPLVLAGHDLLGVAQTGTGKTAAFCLPMLQILEKNNIQPKSFSPRALILTPTRELALQILENLNQYSKHLNMRHTAIFGGVGQGNQVSALRSGIDILVATPGRLMDLIQQKYVKLNQIEIFVLDEADKMLDMGFMPDVKKITKDLPAKKHTLLFSATMPNEIQTLAKQLLNNPKYIEITPETKTVDKITQQVMYVEKDDKLKLLQHLLKENSFEKVLVFVEMKHQASRITGRLEDVGIRAVTIHSDRSQNQRQRALEDFKSDKARVLVATDIAARGIDVDNITHVINFDLSHMIDSYVHRIGRTARAGTSGIAISFSTGDEKSYLYAIQKEINKQITVIKNQPFHSLTAENATVLSLGQAKAKLEAKRRENKAANRRTSSDHSQGGGSRPGGHSGGRSGRDARHKQAGGGGGSSSRGGGSGGSNKGRR